MAQKSTSQLQTDLAAAITTNGTRSITGAILRTLLGDMIDSFVNWLTDGALVGLRTYQTTIPYLAGYCCIKDGKLLKANANTSGAFDDTKWDLVYNYEEISYGQILADVVADNTVTEIVIASFNYKNVTGKPTTWKGKYWGKFSCGAGTLTFNVKINGVNTVSQVTNAGASSNRPIVFDFILSHRNFSGAPKVDGMCSLITDLARKTVAGAPQAVNLTDEYNIQVSMVWSAAIVGNTATISHGNIDFSQTV